ncbi:MAG: hypothetical protein GIW95_04180 [Candidatus Eremiobacteraeota bacterium]|nr:hypothetical protein [Candidatus Eremiobacteraeota bacterium]
MTKRSIALLAACFFVLSSSFAAYAQVDPGYKLGDRVEADPTTLSDGPYKKWLKATIIDVVQNGYLVLIDGEFPRHGAIINYDPRSSRRIVGHVDVPNCPKGGQTTAALEAEVSCWDTAAKRQAQPNAQQARQPAPAAPANSAGNPPGGNVQGAKFKVGDRVETDPYRFREGSPYKRWKKETIAEVYGPHNYRVVLDFPPGTAQPRDVMQADEPYNLRALAEPNRGAPVFVSVCPASDPDTGRYAELHRIIREQRDKPQQPGYVDGRQTVQFESFRVGAPVPYDPEHDAYGGANPRKGVIPVLATQTICTERGPGKVPYHRRLVDATYRCFETQSPGHPWNCSWTGAREEWSDGVRQ